MHGTELIKEIGGIRTALVWRLSGDYGVPLQKGKEEKH